MRCWLFFHADPQSDHPEAAEARRFAQTAERMGVDLEILQPQNFDLVVDSESNWSAIYDGRLLEKPDFIIPRTGSETTYFMLAVLRHFEQQGVRIVNSSLAIEAVADKLHTQQILSAKNIPTPKTILGKFPVDADLIERELGFPVVVKTLRGTRGGGVLLCGDKEHFKDLASLIDCSNPNSDFIFQQYISRSHGRDVRVLVVFGEVIACMERRSADGGFKSNISLGGKGARFDAPEDMKKLAIQVAENLRLDIAGIDVLFDENGYRICEANSSPGFQGLEAACQMDVPEMIFKALQRQLKRESSVIYTLFSPFLPKAYKISSVV